MPSASAAAIGAPATAAAWAVLSVEGWRALVLICALPGWLAFGGLWMLHESPRWLLSQGRAAEALRVLRAIAATNGGAFEADYRARVGDTFFDSICEALQQLAEFIPLPVRSAKVPSAKLVSSLGLLPLLSVHVQRELMLATERRGHLGLKMSHAQVLPLIGPDGAQVTTLARIQGVSRQAISSTARDLETLGFLARASDARDGRAVVFKLTSKGESLIADSVRSLDELDDKLFSN